MPPKQILRPYSNLYILFEFQLSYAHNSAESAHKSRL